MLTSIATLPPLAGLETECALYSGVYRIGELARQTGVSPHALRFYERRGLVHPLARSEGGYRLYGEEAIRRLHFK
ncbi:MAG: MerR family DNA-binding transcriptional regulator [Thermus caldifontis]